ncbi:hypothetical protein Bbelb_014480 [Branchiostoma belcheri]|nr:hypothetical protein Bbelb_014480 [Branchiostoma belcheri]
MGGPWSLCHDLSHDHQVLEQRSAVRTRTWGQRIVHGQGWRYQVGDDGLEPSPTVTLFVTPKPPLGDPPDHLYRHAHTVPPQCHLDWDGSDCYRRKWLQICLATRFCAAGAARGGLVSPPHLELLSVVSVSDGTCQGVRIPGPVRTARAGGRQDASSKQILGCQGNIQWPEERPLAVERPMDTALPP